VDNKHEPFQYDTCKCSDCQLSRLRKENEMLKERSLSYKLGTNWKNILAGLGDQ